jgi:hypothetical protein
MKSVLKYALGICLGLILFCLIGAVVIDGLFGLLFAPDAPYIDELFDPYELDTSEEIIPPLAIGESAIHNGLVISVDAYEVLDEYADEYGRITEPPEGAKFVWVHISVKNVGENAIDTPYGSRFKLVYQGKRIIELYRDREGYPDYRWWELFPNVEKEGWLGYVVPAAAEAVDLYVNFNEYIWKLSQ